MANGEIGFCLTCQVWIPKMAYALWVNRTPTKVILGFTGDTFAQEHLNRYLLNDGKGGHMAPIRLLFLP